MIKSLKDKRTEAVLGGKAPKGFPADLVSVGRRKLLMIEAATSLEDLRFPPGNRLELLKGDRAGLHSIRVNDQFRVCFGWTKTGADDLEITDYH